MKYGEMNARGFLPVEPESTVACGVDIGFSGDNSVCVTIERLRLPIPPEEGGVDSSLRQRLGDPKLIVRGVVIWPLKTAFLHIINHVKKIQVTLGRDTEILVDCTGSLPFAESAHEAGLIFT